MIGTIVPTTYGDGEILGYERIGGSWRRSWEYRPHDGGKPVIEGLWCASDTDVTPPQPMGHGYGPDGYNPDCSWCWLGYGHTQAAHAARLP